MPAQAEPYAAATPARLSQAPEDHLIGGAMALPTSASREAVRPPQASPTPEMYIPADPLGLAVTGQSRTSLPPVPHAPSIVQQYAGNSAWCCTGVILLASICCKRSPLHMHAFCRMLLLVSIWLMSLTLLQICSGSCILCCRGALEGGEGPARACGSKRTAAAARPGAQVPGVPSSHPVSPLTSARAGDSAGKD